MKHYPRWRRAALDGRENDTAMHKAVYMLNTAVAEFRLVTDLLRDVELLSGEVAPSDYRRDSLAIVGACRERIRMVLGLLDSTAAGS